MVGTSFRAFALAAASTQNTLSLRYAFGCPPDSLPTFFSIPSYLDFFILVSYRFTLLVCCQFLPPEVLEDMNFLLSHPKAGLKAGLAGHTPVSLFTTWSLCKLTSTLWSTITRASLEPHLLARGGPLSYSRYRLEVMDICLDSSVEWPPNTQLLLFSGNPSTMPQIERVPPVLQDYWLASHRVVFLVEVAIG